MTTGKFGLILIKKAEGFIPNIYDDCGHPAIGYGQRLTYAEAEKYKDGISEEEATKLLQDHLSILENSVNRILKVQLKEHQFDAIMSFAYNVGFGRFMESTLLKFVNTSQFDKVPAEFMKWTKAGGKELPGLVARRKVEVELWNGDVSNEVFSV